VSEVCQYYYYGVFWFYELWIHVRLFVKIIDKKIIYNCKIVCFLNETVCNVRGYIIMLQLILLKKFDFWWVWCDDISDTC